MLSRSVPSLCAHRGRGDEAASTARSSNTSAAHRRPTLERVPVAILQARCQRLACRGVATIWTIGYERLLPPELVGGAARPRASSA